MPMPQNFDVIITGGGVIGASIAWRLARNHLHVLLLDARTIGSEASSAAAGMLTPGGEFDQPLPARFRASQPRAISPISLRSLQADSGLPVEFRRANAIQIAFTPAELDSTLQRASLHRPRPSSAPLLPSSPPMPSAPSTTPTKPSSIPLA